MKNTIYATVAATIAMFATSGIVALATAAPTQEAPVHAQETLDHAERALVAHLDSVIQRQLNDVKARLGDR